MCSQDVTHHSDSSAVVRNNDNNLNKLFNLVQITENLVNLTPINEINIKDSNGS